jgi:transcription antitermination factor NusG
LRFQAARFWTERAGAYLNKKETKLENQWFAVRVKSRSEKSVATALGLKGIEVFAALAQQRRVWADRVRVVEMPLFPGYVFARFDFAAKRAVEDAAGVASIVSFGNQCCPVPPLEIEGIQRLISSGVDVHASPLLQAGVPVRVVHGPLRGTEGTLVRVRDEYRLLVSVTILQRAVTVEIDQAYVEPLPHRFERVA